MQPMKNYFRPPSLSLIREFCFLGFYTHRQLSFLQSADNFLDGVCVSEAQVSVLNCHFLSLIGYVVFSSFDFIHRFFSSKCCCQVKLDCRGDLFSLPQAERQKLGEEKKRRVILKTHSIKKQANWNSWSLKTLSPTPFTSRLGKVNIK